MAAMGDWTSNRVAKQAGPRGIDAQARSQAGRNAGAILKGYIQAANRRKAGDEGSLAAR